MTIQKANIQTIDSEDQRLLRSLGERYTKEDIENIVNTIYESRHKQSDLVVALLHIRYNDVDLDTIDIVMMLLKQVFLVRDREMI